MDASHWITDDAANITLPVSGTFSTSSCTAPAITGNPPNRTICANGNTTFSTTATGTGLTYQWQVNTGSGFTNISDGGVYSTATTSILRITGATGAMTGYQYRCVVTGTCGTLHQTVAPSL